LVEECRTNLLGLGEDKILARNLLGFGWGLIKYLGIVLALWLIPFVTRRSS
jgi:hypothetical protein